MAYEYTTIDGKRVEVNVAEAFKNLAAAFNRQFGLTLHVRSGTRTRAEQQVLYDRYISGRGNLAAVPGTSLHEESNPRGPRALDVYDSGTDWGVTRAGTVRANWLRRNAPTYKFNPAGYYFKAMVEPWHIEYTGVFSNSSGSNPFDISNVEGLQVLSRANGGNTAIDNKWGPESQKGFAEFLRRNWAYVGNDVFGPNMTVAMAEWLRRKWGYVGNDILGPNMRAALTRANDAHKKYGVTGVPPTTTTTTTRATTTTTTTRATTTTTTTRASNPFGISDVRGLQKIARLNGGVTAIDNKWGPQSAKGFAAFLRRKYGYSGNDVLGPIMWRAIARWLRSRWGYVGNDIPGPNMRAALKRANDANYKAL